VERRCKGEIIMDLIFIAGLSLVLGIILLCIGLSFVGAGLKSLDFTDSYGATTSNSYYLNPLHTLNSKYFHYRPKGSVIVSKKQWADIERNMGIKLLEAKTAGKSIGYKQAIVEIQDKVTEEKAKTFPSSPYAVLDLEASAPLAALEERYNYLLKIYDPRAFVDLDKAFIELAEIRTQQVKRAWSQINLGIKPAKGLF
jgi:hypothetical protein